MLLTINCQKIFFLWLKVCLISHLNAKNGINYSRLLLQEDERLFLFCIICVLSFHFLLHVRCQIIFSRTRRAFHIDLCFSFAGIFCDILQIIVFFLNIPLRSIFNVNSSENISFLSFMFNGKIEYHRLVDGLEAFHITENFLFSFLSCLREN